MITRLVFRWGIRAAAEAGRVVVVLVAVRDRAVRTAIAVLRRVEPEAALEGAVGVGGPLGQVPDHVVDAEVVRAVWICARLRDAAFELVVARIVELGEA